MPEAPGTDPMQEAANEREGWRARRASRLPRCGRYDSCTWLGEALTGARIALLLNDQAMLAQCMGEGAALALGSALAQRIGADTLHLRGGADGDLDIPAVPCLPSQWQRAIAMTLAVADETLLGEFALLAMHPVLAAAENPGERFNAALAEATLSVAYELPSAEEVLARCGALAVNPDESATVNALRALAGSSSTPIRLPDDGFNAYALAALARERGHATVSAGAWVPLPTPLYPRLDLVAPTLAVRTPREAAWFFEVRGLPGILDTGADADGGGRRCLRAADGRWQVEGRFVAAADTASTAAPALDPGELLALADRLAEQVEGRAPADAEALAAQRGLLVEAIEVLRLVRSLCDAGSGSVPEYAFTSLDGRAVREREPGRFEAARLDAVLRTYEGIASEFDAAAPAPGGAREQALAWTSVLRAELEPLLRALARDREGKVAQALRPREEDFAKAFPGLDAKAVLAAYAAVWKEGSPPRLPRADQSELLCHLAPAGMLVEDNELSFRFPGGYRWIAPYLDPHRVWTCWKFVRPGARSGMAYDGLVWLDDHWAWFPKPYRVLAHLYPGRPQGQSSH